MNEVHDAKRLAELQALPLDRKIQITQTRIIEWYKHYDGNVCVSFSGGKDSTVLLHIARRLYPDIPAVFSDTGLEYPEIREFARSFDNVDVVRPKMNFGQVISTYGYPLIGKEVAEAIYYARRLRSAERERETGGVTLNTHTHTHTPRRPRDSMQAERTSWRKKEELSGNRPIGKDWKWGGEKNHLIQTSISRNRRTVLTGRMPGAGVVGKIGDANASQGKVTRLATGTTTTRHGGDTNSGDSETPG